MQYLSFVFQFIRENALYYYFYSDLVFVQFFTKNKIGYWFYFFTVFCVFWGEKSSFYSPSYFFTCYIVGVSVFLALIKSDSPARSFMEKILEKGVIDDLISDSPLQLIINSLKPYFLATVLDLIIFFREVAQIEAYDEKLQNLYGEVAVTIEPSGLKGVVTELNSFLSDLSWEYLSAFLFISFLVFFFSLGKKKIKVEKN